MDLSIAIAQWNVKDLLKNCLESIYKNKYDFNLEVIVVDNASTDGSVRMVKEEFPQVVLIENEENKGFPTATNQAIKVSKGRYILLLNSDTIVKEDTFKKMMNFMDKHEDTGVLGCKLYYPGGKLQLSCYHFPDMTTVISEGFFLDRLFPRSPIFGKYKMSYWDYNQTREVDWVMGSCFMVRRKAMEEVGFMDETYFMWGDDIDWCYRFRQKGWKIYFTPETNIIHYEGKSTVNYDGKDSYEWRGKMIVESYKSLDKYFNKFYDKDKIDKIRMVKKLGTYYRILIWGGIYVFYVLIANKNRFLAKSRLNAYIQILRIIRERRRLIVAMDVSSIYRSKAGVGHYTNYLMKNFATIDTYNKYHYLGYRDRMQKSESVTPGFFRRAASAMKHMFWEQIYLPFNLMRKNVRIFHSPAYVSSVLKPCPRILTIHDMSFLIFPDKFLKSYRLYLKTWVPISAKLADVVITDSYQSKKDIVDLLKIPEEKVKVIYLGVDNIFAPINDKEALGSVRQKYRLPENFILYVGTLEPRKNIIGLIEAYHRLKDKTDGFYKLVIAGKRGWLYDDIFQTVDKLKLEEDVVFTDYIPDEDLPLLYNLAKTFVYPSLYEGFGLPPLEAMACGVPVVTSNSSSLPEIVGDAGLMVDPTNYDELANAIHRVLTDEELRSRFIEKGIQKAKHFTWEETARKTLELYNSVLAGKN